MRSTTQRPPVSVCSIPTSIRISKPKTTREPRQTRMTEQPSSSHYPRPYPCSDDEDQDDSSSIRVLMSPARSYKYENGRRYHSYREGSYWGPNDEKDAYHQAITHHLFCLTLEDRLHLSPVSNPRHILDIGTGIGLWATDIADAYPEAEILATDLSPTWEDAVQPNLRLEVDDCCSKWTYLDEGREPFDLIHIRCLFGSVADWPALYKQSFDHLTPGGYIEQAELSLVPRGPFENDTSSSSLPMFHQWHQFWKRCSLRTGKSWLIADTLQQSMKDAGFEDVRETRFKWPIGSWPSDPRLSEIGRWYRQFWEVGMEGWIMALSTRYMGWTPEQARDFIRKTQEVLRDGEQRIYHEVVIVHGRKPDQASESRNR